MSSDKKRGVAKLDKEQRHLLDSARDVCTRHPQSYLTARQWRVLFSSDRPVMGYLFMRE